LKSWHFKKEYLIIEYFEYTTVLNLFEEFRPIAGIDNAAFQVHIPPSADSLFAESGNVMPPFEAQMDVPCLDAAHNVNTAASITKSKDRLFCIKFTPDRTMKAEHGGISFKSICKPPRTLTLIFKPMANIGVFFS